MNFAAHGPGKAAGADYRLLCEMPRDSKDRNLQKDLQFFYDL